MLGELDDLAALAGAGRVAVVREAAERGEIGASQARSVVAWTEEHAPSLRAVGPARSPAPSRYAAPRSEPAHRRDPDATIPVPVAVTVADQYHRIRHRLHPDATDTVLAAMTHHRRRARLARVSATCATGSSPVMACPTSSNATTTPPPS